MLSLNIQARDQVVRTLLDFFSYCDLIVTINPAEEFDICWHPDSIDWRTSWSLFRRNIFGDLDGDSEKTRAPGSGRFSPIREASFKKKGKHFAY